MNCIRFAVSENNFEVTFLELSSDSKNRFNRTFCSFFCSLLKRSLKRVSLFWLNIKSWSDVRSVVIFFFGNGLLQVSKSGQLILCACTCWSKFLRQTEAVSQKARQTCAFLMTSKGLSLSTTDVTINNGTTVVSAALLWRTFGSHFGTQSSQILWWWTKNEVPRMASPSAQQEFAGKNWRSDAGFMFIWVFESRAVTECWHRLLLDWCGGSCSWDFWNNGLETTKSGKLCEDREGHCLPHHCKLSHRIVCTPCSDNCTWCNNWGIWGIWVPCQVGSSCHPDQWQTNFECWGWWKTSLLLGQKQGQRCVVHQIRWTGERNAVHQCWGCHVCAHMQTETHIEGEHGPSLQMEPTQWARGEMRSEATMVVKDEAGLMKPKLKIVAHYVQACPSTGFKNACQLEKGPKVQVGELTESWVCHGAGLVGSGVSQKRLLMSCVHHTHGLCA